MDPDRRRLLAAAGASLATAAAGCLEAADDLRDRVRYRSDRIRWFRLTDGPVGHIALRDGRLYALTYWRVHALSAADGSTAWTRLLDDPDDTVSYDAALAIDGDAVYVGGADGLRSLSTVDGTVRWHVDDPAPMERLTLAAGTLYARSRGLAAVDPADGSVRWRALVDGPELSPPTVSHDTVYAGDDGGRVAALDATDGTVLWRTDLGTERAAVPVRDGDSVYVGGDYPHEERGELHALDAADGTTQWHVDTGQVLFDTAPALSPSAAFVGTGSGQLVAHRRSDGRRLWSFDAADRLVGPPALGPSGATVYCPGSFEGNYYAVVAADGRARWTVGVDASLAPPVVTDDAVYAASGDGVFALETGSPS